MVRVSLLYPESSLKMRERRREREREREILSPSHQQDYPYSPYIKQSLCPKTDPIPMRGCSSLTGRPVTALRERHLRGEIAEAGKLPHDSITKSLGLAASGAELVVSRYMSPVKLLAVPSPIHTKPFLH